MTVPIDGILVDLETLRRIRHACDAAHCDRAHHCCGQYEIGLGRREMGRMIGLMERAADYAPHLREGRGLVNPFDEDGPGRFVIDTDENQRCVFAYEVDEDGGNRDKRGGGKTPMTYCSLHSAALDAGLEPYVYKPRSCALWPLALSEDTPPVLTVQDADGEFACNRLGRPRRDGRLDPGIEDLLARIFGAAFLAKVLGRWDEAASCKASCEYAAGENGLDKSSPNKTQFLSRNGFLFGVIHVTINEKDLARRMAHFEEVCRDAGVKLTHQRREIFREVARTEDHPDAESVHKEICKRLPNVSLDTVYRTLWMLDDLGLVKTLGASMRRTRFDANIQRHHHFVCIRCGLTRDIHSAAFDSLVLPESLDAIGRVEMTHVEVRGVCHECEAKQESIPKRTNKKEKKA